MKKVCISGQWYLKKPGQTDYTIVDLPNDYAISQKRDPQAPGLGSCAFFPGGTGRYVKYLTLDEREAHYILDVDGAYMCAEVYMNEQHLGVHPYGYTPFLVDLTPKVRLGRINKLVISTNALQPSTRWYSGAGLYRDVFLWSGGKVRVEPRDVFVRTLKADEKQATLAVSWLISADQKQDVLLRARILDDGGRVVAQTELTVSAAEEQKTSAEWQMEIDSPHLWNLDSPALYSLCTELIVGDEVTDEDRTSFGIRTISADVENGFLLNGKPLKLQGGCIHHDNGVLGAAAWPAAEERKISLLKNAGFNAVRIAHNPPSLALLEACDRLGMLVMDEAFDMWNERMKESDYHLWFADWWARDIRDMVLRDRNHPCVVSYSIGNEVQERSGKSDGALWSARLTAEVKKYDDTRLVTSAVTHMWTNPESIDPPQYAEDFLEGYADIGNGDLDSSWDKRTEVYMAPLDIVGYNYLYRRYEHDHKRYPQRIIWGSETFTMQFYDSWQAVLRNSYVLGDFTWTAYDNMGEVGGGIALWKRDGDVVGLPVLNYPWRTCYQGDLDLCGYRRPQSYFREAIWRENTEPRIFTEHPEHFGEPFSGTGWHWPDRLDSWSFDEKYVGRPVHVEVYTTADEIRFLLNGRFQGTAIPEKGIASMDIRYERGCLTALAYRGGVLCGESYLNSVGEAVGYSALPEKTEMKADGRDLCYINLLVTDSQGRRVPDAKKEIHCVVHGGELMGVFSGDPCNEDQYTSDTCHTYEGRALAIVRAVKPGKVTLTAYGSDLAGVSCSIEAK